MLRGRMAGEKLSSARPPDRDTEQENGQGQDHSREQKDAPLLLVAHGDLKLERVATVGMLLLRPFDFYARKFRFKPLDFLGKLSAQRFAMREFPPRVCNSTARPLADGSTIWMKHGQGKICAYEAALQHRHDRSR